MFFYIILNIFVKI